VVQEIIRAEGSRKKKKPGRLVGFLRRWVPVGERLVGRFGSEEDFESRVLRRGWGERQVGARDFF